MHVLRCILLLLLPVVTTAQKIKMQDGKVMKDGKVYCLYEQQSQKRNVLPVNVVESGLKDNPEVSGSDFSNYIFSTAASEQLIFATAKVLSSAPNQYLQYYYNIKFPLIGREINIIYHPYLVEYFTNDIVNMDLMSNDMWNDMNARKLFDKWSAKPTIVPYAQIEKGSVRNYNIGGTDEDAPDLKGIIVIGHNIYRDSQLLATYNSTTTISFGNIAGFRKDDYIFSIATPDGSEIALVQVPRLRSVFYILGKNDKTSTPIYTAERVEKNIIAMAANYLFPLNDSVNTTK